MAIALSQIGEFSFILATIGRDLESLTPTATNALVAVSIVSIVLNPILYRTIDPIERRLTAKPRLRRLLNRPSAAPSEPQMSKSDAQRSPRHRAVIVGYGPTGRPVVRRLRENDITPTVIERNVGSVRTLREEGVDAIYGDAAQPDTLAAANTAKAGVLIPGSAGMANGPEVSRLARSLNPNIRVLARATYLRDVSALEGAGTSAVYSGEGEVALAFIEDILDSLGATAEQIDRERARPIVT